MLNRKALFSVFAVAAIAVAAALTANSASAAAPKGHGVIKGNGGNGGGGGAWNGPKGPGNVKGNGPGVKGPKSAGPKLLKPSWCFNHPWRCRAHVHVVRYPVVTTAVATAAISRPAAAGPCTCLTKTYLPDGAVMFKDVCTQEVAINPPEQQAQAR